MDRGRPPATPVTNVILALNAGSSSLKFGLYRRTNEDDPTVVLQGSVRTLVENSSKFIATAADGRALVDEQWPTSADRAVERLLGWLESQLGSSELTAIGHRVVHGGPDFSEPVEIDDSILSRLEALTALAPLHQPATLLPIQLIRMMRPDLPQVACFDTAFHRQMGPPANRYALPREIEAQGIRRYGFHGLSYESIAAQLASDDHDQARHNSRVIVAHLGNGASLCAMHHLQSVDTTMGFSTLDGLVMGTRPGALDPGILLYLLKEKGFSVSRLEQLLYRECGLLGVSGISADVATLLASEAPAAAEALDLFAFQVARQIAALAATLGGFDRLVFTGGIGEHAPTVRRMIIDRLQWLGLDLDEQANASDEVKISGSASAVLVERRSTQEELMIARHVVAVNCGRCA
ncbi:MAG: acetate/propionate family kinase [Thermomicrobiales bacterium]